jgi:hypothetical protein
MNRSWVEEQILESWQVTFDVADYIVIRKQKWLFVVCWKFTAEFLKSWEDETDT